MARSVSGFTLVELILVILLLGIVGTASFSYLGLGAKMYADAADREALLSSSRFAVERLSRELRNVVPNSVRTFTDSGRNCIEFAPLIKAGRYSPGVATGSASGTVSLVSPDGWTEVTGYSQPLLMTIYPTDASRDIYGEARVAESFSFTASGTSLTVTYSFNDIPTDSPSQRMYFFSLPVAYCLEGTELYRYQRTALNQPLTGRMLMAEHLSAAFYGPPRNEQPFQYDNSRVLTRNSVVHLRLAFESAMGDVLVFNQEIHTPNVP
ncbi:prepilin-type N-terminal cleavage/methylation domain-containing protein [Rheinheimera sp.]|uniref:prepilin-type N-terminal cleavage/methylation domain-containing protein n=1 Tax=Rheinheimera sp. TaxID=1869214 RepID=UPI00307D0EF7